MCTGSQKRHSRKHYFEQNLLSPHAQLSLLYFTTMKLFGWAHTKLLPITSLVKKQHNADGLFEIRTTSLPWDELGVQAQARRDAHTEVLTIGTLGLGSLISMRNGGHEDGEEEELELEAHSVSPNRESMSSNHVSASSNPASMSSNVESVSSVNIQKLQEELQKILYFNLGQEHKVDVNTKSNAPLDGRCKGKTQKHKRDKYGSTSDANAKRIGNADGKSHVPIERGLFPLHLEMPLDNMHSNSTRAPYKKMLSKKQYLLLIQSLKSKLLHYISPTRVNLLSFLFEKLVSPNFQRDLQHGSSMDKVLQVLRKVMHKKPHGWWRKTQDGNNYEVNEQSYTNEEDGDDERLKWAVVKSWRGSEKLINYIASTLAHVEKDQASLFQAHHYHHHPFHDEECGNLEHMLATSPYLDNECWIKTDDEYLVLQLSPSTQTLSRKLEE